MTYYSLISSILYFPQVHLTEHLFIGYILDQETESYYSGPHSNLDAIQLWCERFLENSLILLV